MDLCAGEFYHVNGSGFISIIVCMYKYMYAVYWNIVDWWKIQTEWAWYYKHSIETKQKLANGGPLWLVGAWKQSFKFVSVFA